MTNYAEKKLVLPISSPEDLLRRLHLAAQELHLLLHGQEVIVLGRCHPIRFFRFWYRCHTIRFWRRRKPAQVLQTGQRWRTRRRNIWRTRINRARRTSWTGGPKWAARARAQLYEVEKVIHGGIWKFSKYFGGQIAAVKSRRRRDRRYGPSGG